MYEGVVIAESLSGGSVPDGMRVVESKVVDITAPAEGQPSTWTVLKIEVQDSDAAGCAEVLADRLGSGPWYVDFNNGEHSYVVFSGRVFDYRRGDEATLQAARAHARMQGIPEDQIDWAVPG